MTVDRLGVVRSRDRLRDDAALIDSLQAELAARDAVLSAMSEGVLLFDSESHLAYANHAALTILGRRYISAEDIVPAPVREAIAETRRNVSAHGHAEPVTRELALGGAAVEATALPGIPAGTILVVLRDVTRARNIERIRRDFVANASHALKTPVASILALSGAVSAAATDDLEAMGRFLQRLEYEAERLGALVSDLLALSRLEELGTPEWTRVRLDVLIQAAVERLRPRAEAAGLRWHVDVSGALLVMGSEADLAHLVHNLLDNAVRYTRKGGEVWVSAKRLDRFAEVAAADTGIGIPARDLDRVFERFYRVQASQSHQTGGTGLGLAIVRHIAESHGGTASVRSRLGAGSTFTVRIPLLD